jgi:hypothetical protein
LIGERFTDETLDVFFLSELINQYLKKHGLGDEVVIFGD